jgi:hypothetical protein
MRQRKRSAPVVVDTLVGHVRKSHVQETVPCMANVSKVNAVAMLITLATIVQREDALTIVLVKVLVAELQITSVSVKMDTLEMIAKKKLLASTIALVMANVPW